MIDGNVRHAGKTVQRESGDDHLAPGQNIKNVYVHLSENKGLNNLFNWKMLNLVLFHNKKNVFKGLECQRKAFHVLKHFREGKSINVFRSDLAHISFPSKKTHCKLSQHKNTDLLLRFLFLPHTQPQSISSARLLCVSP